MEEIAGYAIQIRTPLGFEDAIVHATQLLQEEGFGILTEIDVQATLKKKLGIDFKPYRILGACNPPFAHRTLNAVPQIGVLLPCNVVVWDEGGYRVVAAMEPKVMSRIINHPEGSVVAEEVSQRIRRALERMEQLHV